MARRGGLGTNLDALIPTSLTVGDKEVGQQNEVAITSISPNPRQPRTHFDPVALEELIASIKEIGILSAIGARQSNIIGIFVAESAIIGLMSSIIATGLALLLTRLINGIFSAVIEKPLSLLSNGFIEITLLTPKLWIIGAVILFSVLYAVIAGLIPSFRASKINAVKALRRE